MTSTSEFRSGKARLAAGAALGIALLLSACAGNSDVEIQQDGSGTDAPKASPCACERLPYDGPAFTWGRG